MKPQDNKGSLASEINVKKTPIQRIHRTTCLGDILSFLSHFKP